MKKKKDTTPEKAEQMKSDNGAESSAPDKLTLAPTVSTGERSLVRYDPLQMYLLEIKKYQLLTREEEVELATKVREEQDEKIRIRSCHLQSKTGCKNCSGFSSLLDKKPDGFNPGRESGSFAGCKEI